MIFSASTYMVPKYLVIRRDFCTALRMRSKFGIISNAHNLTAVTASGLVLNAIFAMKLEQCRRRAEQCTVHSGCARALCASAQWIGTISTRLMALHSDITSRL